MKNYQYALSAAVVVCCLLLGCTSKKQPTLVGIYRCNTKNNNSLRSKSRTTIDQAFIKQDLAGISETTIDFQSDGEALLSRDGKTRRVAWLIQDHGKGPLLQVFGFVDSGVVVDFKLSRNLDTIEFPNNEPKLVFQKVR